MDVDSKYGRNCRICFEDFKAAISLFGEEGKEMQLQAKIRKYLYITVFVDDKLPKMICEDCVTKLDGIHKFAVMAGKTQDKFNKLLSEICDTETKQTENRGLLHSYLTKGCIDKYSMNDNEVTEVEVRVDPMIILQCTGGDEDITSNVSSTEDDDTNHSTISIKSENSVDDLLKNRKPHKCSICPRRFTSQLALQNHMWSHSHRGRKILGNSENVTMQEETEEACPQSDPSENTENSNETLACPVCGKNISTKGNLKVHLESHRPKGKYGCDICMRVFKTQSNLYRHKEYHGGVQYPCTVCGRVYPTNSTLRAHSITHSDLRPHKCPLCDKTFKRNQDLKFHINQHTGARPYQCPYCPKAFASSGNCFSHRKRMHPQEVERDREKAAEILR